MKISWVFLVSLTLSGFFLTIVAAPQNDEDSGEREESNIPKKVLRKYRIRRPIVLDNNGIAVTPPSIPRLRRIRVNKSQEQSVQSVSSLSPPLQNSLEPRLLNQFNHLQVRPQPPQQLPQQRVAYDDDESQVIEPIRVVPTYRKATPSSTRSALLANVNLKDRGPGDEDSKKQPIGTTRNYSAINEDGSFTFGYTGEDGSFKEETRGTDCVVRGKYGYVDPDGVSREFSYVSGNPCDPNDPNKDEEVQEDEDLDDTPLGTPISQPRRPITPNVHQNLDQSENRGNEQQLPPNLRPNPRKRVPTLAPPTFLQPTTFRPRVRISQGQPSSTASPLFLQSHQLQERSPLPQFRQPQQLTPSPFSVTAGPRLGLDERGANRAFKFDQEFQHIHQQQFRSQPQQQQFVTQPTPQQQQFVTQPTPQQHQFVSQPTPQQQQFVSQPTPQQQQFVSQPTPQQQQFVTQPTPQQHQFVSQPPQQQPFVTQPPQQQQFVSQPPRPSPTSFHRLPQRQYFGGANAATLLQQQQPTPTQSAQHFQQARPILPQPQLQSNSLEQQSPPNGNFRTEIVFDPTTGRYISVLVQKAPTPASESEEYTLTQRLRGFVEPRRQQFQVQTRGQPQLQYYQQQQQQPTNSQTAIQQAQHFNPTLFPRNQHAYQPSPGSITQFHADAQEAMNSPASGQIEAFLSSLNIPA